MHTLNILTPGSYEASVPFRLPDAITFDCFIPGIGLAQACLHPSSLETDARGTVAADIGDIEVWRPEDTTRSDLQLKGPQEVSLDEQAMDVLSHVLDALNARLANVERAMWATLPVAERAKQAARSSAAVLMLIAEMAEAEATAHEAWAALPETVRNAFSYRNRPPDPSDFADRRDLASANALAAYVEMLAEQAQAKATEAAKAREQAALDEQAEEHAASVRAERTDHAIDVWKEGR